MNRESFVDWVNCYKEFCVMVDFGYYIYYIFKFGGDFY